MREFYKLHRGTKWYERSTSQTLALSCSPLGNTQSMKFTRMYIRWMNFVSTAGAHISNARRANSYEESQFNEKFHIHTFISCDVCIIKAGFFRLFFRCAWLFSRYFKNIASKIEIPRNRFITQRTIVRTNIKINFPPKIPSVRQFHSQPTALPDPLHSTTTCTKNHTSLCSPYHHLRTKSL